MNWYVTCMKKYLVFEGRARRTEYWMFILFYTIIMMLISFVSAFLGEMTQSAVFAMLPMLFALAHLIPLLAVSWRRMQDINKSGAWLFISFIPVIGWIWFIVLAATEGSKGQNQYGSDPKASA